MADRAGFHRVSRFLGHITAHYDIIRNTRVSVKFEEGLLVAGSLSRPVAVAPACGSFVSST